MKDRRKLHVFLNSMISSLVCLLFIFYVIFAVDFVVAMTLEEKDLGTGIGAAICIVFMVIIDIGEAVLGTIGAVYSSLVKKQMDGRYKTAITAFRTFDIVLPALAIFSSAVLFILNNLGVFS